MKYSPRYNIYTCSDGRIRCYDKYERKVVSYPRALYEFVTGMKLYKNQQIHHIDGNPLNNDISNLEVCYIGEHQKHHNPRKYYEVKKFYCKECGREIYLTPKQQMYLTSTINRGRNGPFCSRRCTGIYGARIQNSFC